MISLTNYLRSVRSIADDGPEYVNGGLTRKKCDCVGLPMLAMIENGHKAYPMHSSNYFYRYQTDDLRTITDETDVELGMLLYKTRGASEAGYDLSDTYLSGRYNTGDYLDAYHVGVVIGIEPLQIVECTSTGEASGIKYTATLGNPARGGWDCGGRQKDVDYDDYNEEEVNTMALTGKTCTVVGGGLNMRKTASKSGTLVIQIPDGTEVYCYSDTGTWVKIKYDTDGKTYVGYVMSQYLEESDDQDGDGTESTDETSEETVSLTLTTSQAAVIKEIAAML